ncbi:adenylate/guanylate cyclase domain-containing protein [Roseibium porphyridii]|uniref:Adenylate/guanylate cyclase domain-containing protein n=1 Tax=Roseibium porphyridii TaxID=2866279 RepID=A0ABY8F947_9HYPH|nr:adenylate/guanylate cyclase domain-containing protein [Roseibium sp. KMA01]WFE91976.1 adenylate/guanylate cyclase domain-containing protein [Roseibium sp. KMA01]
MIDSGKLDDLFLWMLDGARPSADARAIVGGICDGLLEAGLPLERFALFIYTLHPNLQGRRFRWLKGEGVDQSDADMTAFDGAEYLNNPLPTVLKTGKMLRRKLCDPVCPDDFLILKEFRGEGITDYVVQPLFFTTGETHLVSWATKADGGFDDDMIAALEKIRLPLARLTETYMLRLNAANLLSAYVGRDSGYKILSGRVHRGDLEEITACVVFADLVAFTKFSNSASAAEVLARLNRFYDCLVPPIVARGGEVLKFMGDGLLAIFPISEKLDDRSACEAALEALREASGGGEKPVFSDAVPPFRAAVHLGPLQYGNIGASDRLDFTAIGPTVNLAARILSSAILVNGQTVVSEKVAELSGISTIGAPTFELKGFERTQVIVPVRHMPAH